MANRYSKTSLERLQSARPELQELFCAVLPIIDHTIIIGHRTEEQQKAAYRDGKTKLNWPNSLHNTYPSRAVDAAPYVPGLQIPWPAKAKTEKEQIQRYGMFYYFAGVVKAEAVRQGIHIRWGGDWDGDNNFTDQRFNDLVHFKLMP